MGTAGRGGRAGGWEPRAGVGALRLAAATLLPSLDDPSVCSPPWVQVGAGLLKADHVGQPQAPDKKVEVKRWVGGGQWGPATGGSCASGNAVVRRRIVRRGIASSHPHPAGRFALRFLCKLPGMLLQHPSIHLLCAFAPPRTYSFLNKLLGMRLQDQKAMFRCAAGAWGTLRQGGAPPTLTSAFGATQPAASCLPALTLPPGPAACLAPCSFFSSALDKVLAAYKALGQLDAGELWGQARRCRCGMPCSITPGGAPRPACIPPSQPLAPCPHPPRCPQPRHLHHPRLELRSGSQDAAGRGPAW